MTHIYIGQVHRNMGRKDLAIKAFVRSSELNPGSERAASEAATTAMDLGDDKLARFYYERCLAIDPGNQTYQEALANIHLRQRGEKRQRFIRFPEAVSDFTNLELALTETLLKDLKLPRVLRSSSRVFAAGSCFATNIAMVLNDRGYLASANNFGEAVNSTLANRAYVDWLFDDHWQESEIAKVIDISARQKMRRSIKASDIVILTVGVVAVFLHRETGELRLPSDEGASVRRLLKECEFRTLTVSENVENLRYIIAKISKNRPNATIFLTLSPVPLSSSSEYPSAIIADCVSKSILRAAIDEVMRIPPPNLHYWPAFEAVRWIGSYSGNAYGDEDGSTRHVSERMIQAITSAFIENITAESHTDK
jgi:hypothetical protein